MESLFVTSNSVIRKTQKCLLNQQRREIANGLKRKVPPHVSANALEESIEKEGTGARKPLYNLQLSHEKDTEMASESMETRNHKQAQRKVPPHVSANALEGNIEKADTGNGKSLCNFQFSHQKDTEMPSEPKETRNR